MSRKAVATASALLLMVCARRSADPVQRLIEASRERRSVEARLSGFEWAPLETVRRGATAPDNLGLRSAAAEVLRDVGRETTPLARHATALAYLVSSDSKRAIDTLSPLVRSAGDARKWNDLAAARVTGFANSGRAQDLVDGLVAVDTALRFDPQLAEARFNRALILGHLGLRPQAEAAWNRFLDVDTGSGWAVEARSRLAIVSASQTSFGEIFRRDYDRLATNAYAARDLARRYPQEARMWGETEVLARWAEAHRNGDAIAGARHLGFARALGDQLARDHGDRMLERAVATIAEAGEAGRDALSRGHLDFRLGQRTYMDGRPGEAERILRRAATALKAGRSPIALLASYFAANTTFDQGRMQEATRQLEALLAELPGDLSAARAQMQWQLGLCRGAQTRWGEALQLFGESLSTFEALGETNHATTMRELMAEVYEMIGDEDSAWRYRTVALVELGRTTTPLLQAVLGFLSQAAVLRQEWAVAASFANLEIETADHVKNDAELADAFLRRALVRHHLRDVQAGQDVVAAREVIARMADAGLRTRLDARRMATEGIVARIPGEGVRLLSDAIAFHETQAGQRMFMPGLLLYRARARRADSDPVRAREDLDRAITELESQRASLASGEQRWGVFESADNIFEEAIDLALLAHDEQGAFAYAERARARALLETMNGAGARATGRLPQATTIVEYALLPERMVIFVVDRAGVRTVTRPLNRQMLRARASQFVDALAAENTSTAMAAGRALYDDLFAPIASLVETSETVVVVPDATLSAVPFAALVAPDGKYLIERHLLVVAPSAAVFKSASTRRAAHETAQRLLIVVHDDPGTGLERLAGAKEEVERIAPFYRSVTMLAAGHATRQTFLREAPRADVIHFAGHALGSDAGPKETSIVLAGPDGRLNVSQIGSLRLLGCSTVVLAACSTARGKVARFEGTLSIARAFLATGVPSVVATLWPIADDDAAQFFPHVHENFARGLSPAAAVRAAQLEWIRASRSPAMWAAVQAIGS